MVALGAGARGKRHTWCSSCRACVRTGVQLVDLHDRGVPDRPSGSRYWLSVLACFRAQCHVVSTCYCVPAAFLCYWDGAVADGIIGIMPCQRSLFCNGFLLPQRARDSFSFF